MNLSVYNTPAQMSNIINLYIYWRCLLCSNCHSTAHITIFFSFASNCVCNAPYIFQSHNKKNMTYMIRRHNIQHYTYTYLYCKYHSGIDFSIFLSLSCPIICPLQYVMLALMAREDTHE